MREYTILWDVINNNLPSEYAAALLRISIKAEVVMVLMTHLWPNMYIPNMSVFIAAYKPTTSAWKYNAIRLNLHKCKFSTSLWTVI